ncbi:maleylacetoacetate isomerase [Marinobacter subterrani]|uniref:Maleylacetoacetate isomerase n=1 Tax=Marinobacter subterrani TaxID=1658765 RepID=A0A0J7J5N8_9GAMM|nr:maleylacetoacetate isomerase [Marinobacter subterrani]KMQ73279.1 maleylacetoacetate isomerase [Marinobacter subterrani]
MKLYGYYRSSTSYRVRIALNLKELDYRQQPVNLLRGEHRGGPYRQLNPQGLVPALETDEGERLTQSLAICEYLEERYPEPSLLPANAADRARVRALVGLLAIEIHPLNNLRVLKYLTGEMGIDEETKLGWYRHWIAEGFEALEAMLAGDPRTGRYCHGDQPGLADACLVPQVYNAERFGCDLESYPTIRRIHAACNELPSFARAHPAEQPDAG